MLISIWGCEGLVKLELLLNNTLLASHDFAHFGYYTYLSHCILIWNFWGHSKTRLDYEFCDNEVWPKHKLTAFLILAIFCFPIEPILCWIACQGIHPLGMKMLHIDQALKYIKKKCQKSYDGYGFREVYDTGFYSQYSEVFWFYFFCLKGKQMHLQSEETLLNQINCFVNIFWLLYCIENNTNLNQVKCR